MKTLYLLRHAKSSWKNEQVKDRDRPLKKKGHLQADAVSDHLAALLPPPQVVLCSPAVRTRETLNYFLELWPTPEERVHYLESLYLAEVDTLRSEVARLDDTFDIAMVVGHNPGLTDLVLSWAHNKATYFESMSTCGFVQMDFEVNTWGDLIEQAGDVKLHLRSKDILG